MDKVLYLTCALSDCLRTRVIMATFPALVRKKATTPHVSLGKLLLFMW